MGQLLAAAGRSQAAFLDQLKTDRATLDQLKAQATAALADSRTLLAQQDQNKTEIARQLATVEQLVSSLTGAQQSELQQLEKVQADEAQVAFLASGALGQGSGRPPQPDGWPSPGRWPSSASRTSGEPPARTPSTARASPRRPGCTRACRSRGSARTSGPTSSTSR